jgi:hypothetical protein
MRRIRKNIRALTKNPTLIRTLIFAPLVSYYRSAVIQTLDSFSLIDSQEWIAALNEFKTLAVDDWAKNPCLSIVLRQLSSDIAQTGTTSMSIAAARLSWVCVYMLSSSDNVTITAYGHRKAIHHRTVMVLDHLKNGHIAPIDEGSMTSVSIIIFNILSIFKARSWFFALIRLFML